MGRREGADSAEAETTLGQIWVGPDFPLDERRCGTSVRRRELTSHDSTTPVMMSP